MSQVKVEGFGAPGFGLDRRDSRLRIAPVVLSHRWGWRELALGGFALIAATLIAASVGDANEVTVDDPGDDARPGCEIVKTTAGHASRGRLVHTISAKAPMSEGEYVVLIFDRKGDVSGGGINSGPSLVMDPAATGVKTKFSGDMRKVTYTIKARKLREEAEIPTRQKKYFWVANGCFQFPDWAPDVSNGGPVTKPHGLRSVSAAARNH